MRKRGEVEMMNSACLCGTIQHFNISRRKILRCPCIRLSTLNIEAAQARGERIPAYSEASRGAAPASQVVRRLDGIDQLRACDQAMFGITDYCKVLPDRSAVFYG